MIKCIFQDCNCKATKTIPCTMGIENTKIDAHLCDFHYELITEKRAYKSFSFEIVGGRKND